MADVVDKKTRSRMMSGIRSKNTKPEITIRKALHRRGFRFITHKSHLPGKPDLVLPRYNAVIFINGCFWHQHDCHLFKWPKSNKKFWREKLLRNRSNDIANLKKLKDEGWYVLTVWECALRGKTRVPMDTLTDRISRWLWYETRNKTIRGRKIR